MKPHRFITEYTIQGKSLLITDLGITHQMKRVLRLKPGEEVVVIGNGKEYLTKIVDFSSEGTTTEIIREQENTREPKTHVRLYCSMLKRENFEFVVQKATEVGVKEIIPLICDRTIKLGVRYDRLEIIAKEAAEQSGRGMVPQIQESLSFSEALKAISKEDSSYFFDFDGKPWSEVSKNTATKNLFIGPEGGWSEPERALAKEHNLIFVSLGSLALRAETAAIVGGYLGVNIL